MQLFVLETLLSHLQLKEKLINTVMHSVTHYSVDRNKCYSRNVITTFNYMHNNIPGDGGCDGSGCSTVDNFTIYAGCSSISLFFPNIAKV